MLDRLIRAFLVVGGVSVACAWTWPGAFPEADPVAVLVRYHTPNVYRAVVAWYDVAPGVAVFLAGQFLISSARIWFARMGVRVGRRSRLPTWPLSPSADGPAIVVGEFHHPVRAIESPTPEWLTIPERGLYTGVAIFGAVGSGKTSACMHPFARQLLSWQATNPERRAAALVLEVKGDFCHDIRQMLTELGRAEDYVELSLDGRLTWNPLSATWLDSYSLAYTVASLLNQLFGKGKEPFWQLAYTNLVRWIIELYRVLPGGWVTLRDVYHCAIDKALFAKKIQQAQTYAADMSDTWITIAATEMKGDHLTPLRAVGFQPDPADMNRFRARAEPAALTYLQQHKITHDRERCESTTASGVIGHPGGRGAQSRRLPMGGTETLSLAGVLATNRRALPVNWARKPNHLVPEQRQPHDAIHRCDRRQSRRDMTGSADDMALGLQELKSHLWDCAEILRGSAVDRTDWKAYILPLLFFKRICDVSDEETAAATAVYGDADAVNFPELHRFRVPEGCHWKDIRETPANVGAALSHAMRAIERTNPDTLYRVFGAADWGNRGDAH